MRFCVLASRPLIAPQGTPVGLTCSCVEEEICTIGRIQAFLYLLRMRMPKMFHPRRISARNRDVTGICFGSPVVPLVIENMSTFSCSGNRAVVCPSYTRRM